MARKRQTLVLEGFEPDLSALVQILIGYIMPIGVFSVRLKLLYSILYPVWGEYPIQSVCFCLSVRRFLSANKSLLFIDKREVTE